MGGDLESRTEVLDKKKKKRLWEQARSRPMAKCKMEES